MSWHKRNGFDAFFLTDHNHHEKTLELVDAQKANRVPSEPLVIAGQEYSGTNHILLLGLKRVFDTKDFSDQMAVDSVRAQGGTAIVAHWFSDENRTLDYYVNQGVDGFEIVNQAEGLAYDESVFKSIKQTCERNRLIMIGSADYHGYGSACFTWNALTIPDWKTSAQDEKRQSVLDIFRERDQSRLKVLKYSDRALFPRNRVVLSPLYSTLSYFRSLNFLQTLSWVIWIMIIFFIVSRLAVTTFWQRFMARRLRPWAILGILSSLIVMGRGAILLTRTGEVSGYNHIYQGFGQTFLIVGLVSIVYSIIIFFKKKAN
jgi:hypothetical protein